jgi:hypothetical protein
MENPFQVITNDLNEIKYLISKNLVQTKEEPEADILNVQEAAKLLNLQPPLFTTNKRNSTFQERQKTVLQ